MARDIKFAATILVLLFLAGCTPEFRTPVAWDGGGFVVHGDRLKDPMRLELYDNGVGYVENFPRGVSGKDEEAEGYICTKVTSDERYTGKISWRVRDQYSFEIEFKDSKYVIASGHGKFGSQSWDELRFAPCGEDTGYWQIWVSCGFVGDAFKNHEANCPARKE